MSTFSILRFSEKSTSHQDTLISGTKDEALATQKVSGLPSIAKYAQWPFHVPLSVSATSFRPIIPVKN